MLHPSRFQDRVQAVHRASARALARFFIVAVACLVGLNAIQAHSKAYTQRASSPGLRQQFEAAVDEFFDGLDGFDVSASQYALTDVFSVRTPNRPVLNDTHVLGNMRMLGQLSSISYCGNASTLRQLGCGTRCASPLVSGIKVTHVIESDRNLAFVAVKDVSKQIIVIFRGSQLENWFDNVEAFRINWPFELTARYSSLSTTAIHKGFFDSYDSLRQRIRSAVRSHLTSPTRSNYTLYLAGHSLGGAMATLAAVDLIASGFIPAHRLHLYSISAPRAGNEEWAQKVSSQVLVPGQSHRITVDDDLVPHTPTRQMGFIHQLGEKYVMGTDKVFVCHEVEDKECSRSRKPFLSANAHRRWFGVDGFFGKSGCRA
ncbi:Alpha/Beta hydrolase protein [Catenaria anguillulae PL171]|uniref:Alpha/Beta hydrolase protein n=1 Tax=Catenaria anguillulae PL171 TaxID=765915 RepID=A0A1Y2H7M2_9FUNG|nr:Alpha/Beta hydrolase protein [Catenaria anguillulae PL171]